MSNAGRLGKGLNALFLENYDLEESPKTGEEIVKIEISQLRANPYQPRRNFNEDKINELATSIKEHGVFQPIIVKKTVKGYIIIAGERRYRACKKAGLTEIPAIVRDFDDRTMMEIALLENLQRENLSPLEEAVAYKVIMDKYNLTQQELGERIGKSRSHVTNMLRVLALPENLQQMLNDKKIDFGHAKVLLGVENKDKMAYYADLIVKDGLSVRALESMIKEEKKIIPKKPIKKNVEKDVHVKQLEEDIMNQLGTNVELVRGNKSGKLIIHFTNDDDLNRVLDKLKLIK